MVRIKGVDISDQKRIEIALTKVYGIGRNLAKQILINTNIDLNKKAGDLNNEELVRLRDEINKHLVEGDLRRETNMDIKT